MGEKLGKTPDQVPSAPPTSSGAPNPSDASRADRAEVKDDAKEETTSSATKERSQNWPTMSLISTLEAPTRTTPPCERLRSTSLGQ